MFHHHENLVEPADDTPLWRYMDFTKFVSILDRRAVFFSALPTLGDPYEGFLTRPRLEQRRVEWDGVADAFPHGRRETISKMLEDHDNKVRQWVFVSCWHMNAIESSAMWSQYLRTGEGVAIRTTFSRFKESFASTPREVMGSVVDYLGYEKDLT